MKLIAIGDNVVDYYRDQGLMYPGGNALNVAVAARRNGAAGCAYLGIVGDDAAGDHVLASMRRERIDAARVRRVYGPNGEAIVSLNRDGDRVFEGTNRGRRVSSLLRLQLTGDDLGYARSYDLIHTSVNSDLEHELDKLRPWPISFDFSTKQRWDEAYLRRICPYLTYAFFSGSDMEPAEITELTTLAHSLGVRVVGVTRGGEPAQFSAGGVRYEQAPRRIRPLDTMGAGDSFIGGFLASYHGSNDMAGALERAAAAAAATCAHYGAFGHGVGK